MALRTQNTLRGGKGLLPDISIARSGGLPPVRGPRLPHSVLLATLVLNTLGLALPLSILQIYDRVLPNQATATLAFIVIGLTLVVILDAAMKMARARIINWTGSAFSQNAAMEAFRRMIKAPPSKIEGDPVSVHMNRLNSLSAIGDFYAGPTRLLIIDVPMAGVYLAIMYLIGGAIVLVPVTLLAVFAVIAGFRNRFLRQVIAQRTDHENRKYDFVIEVLSGIHTVKALALEALMLRRFERLQRQVGIFSHKSIMVGNEAQSTAALYSSLSTICVVTVGAMMAIAGEVSVGVVAACTLLSGQLIQPLMRGISAWAELQNVRCKHDDAAALFDLALTVPAGEAIEGLKGNLTLDNVTLRQEGAEKPLIENLSHAFTPGTITGCLCSEGPERMALIELLCGYRVAEKGQVLVDGHDLGGDEQGAIRRSIAFVDQTPVIFRGSILDNITMFGQRSDGHMARRIAGMVGLEQAVHLFPDGYDTALGEGVGDDIPVSTAQWISITRAIATGPKILILDDATDTLDPASKAGVEAALQKLKNTMTIIVISDKPQVLDIADARLRLSAGGFEEIAAGAEVPAAAGRELAAGQAVSGPAHHLGAAARPVNPVHAQLDMLEASLSAAAEQGQAGASHPAQACLDPLLMALGWHGVERHLFEALPHFDPIATIDDLRAVLVRLNYRTEPIQGRIRDIQPDAFPCLFEAAGKLYVLLGFEEDGVLTAFEGESQQFMDIEDLGLAGTAYILTPIDSKAEREVFQKGNWLSVVAGRFKRLLMLMLGLGGITNLFALALPIYVMTVYDKAIGAKAPDVLVSLTIGIVIIVAVDMVLRHIRARSQAYFGARLDTLVGNHAFSQLLYMPVAMTESASIGGQFTRLRQFESVRETFTGPLASALIDIPFTLVFIAAIAMIGGNLAWVPAILVAVYALVGLVVVPRIRAHVSHAGEAKSKLQNLVMEMLSRQRTIRNVSAEQVWIDRFRTLSADFNLKNLETRALNFNTQTMSQTMMLVAGTATLGFGTLRALEGSLSAGALIGVMALTWRVLNPLNQAFVSLTRLGQTLQSIEQINKLMRLPVERIPNELPSAYRSFKGAITASRLIFRYPARQEPVLRGLQFAVKPGELVAISGASGAGKSTLLKMILGLYSPQSGAVLADGLDVRQLNAGEWRHAISYAPEHLQLFYGSVAQNLKLANPTATEVDITQAAEEMGVLDEEFSIYLPEGVETRLTGKRLRAMPDELKQRILLARTFVKPAPIYLLDSPANNLGDAGERLLMGKIARLRGKSTVIVVTHRRELMNMADRLIYLERGQVALDGPPEKVLARLAAAA